MTKQKPFLYAVSYAAVAVITAAVILILGFTFRAYNSKNQASPLPVFDEEKLVRIVIDAGHGGEDAGAVAADGTLEKDLNLDLAIILSSLLELNGCNTVLTRDSDTLLYDYFDDLEDYTGNKKVYDLKNRLKIAEANENSIYVGIHMNKFSSPKYSGAQIYYSKVNPLSRDIALDMKSSVQAHLQPENKRAVKSSDGSIYILDNAKIPSVLVECGFLSNEAELERLKTPSYRTSLSIVLFSTLSKYAYN